MSTGPVKQVPETPPSETVEERFRQLEATWTAETGYLSSYTDPAVVAGYGSQPHALVCRAAPDHGG
jgi:hypothetical protein